MIIHKAKAVRTLLIVPIIGNKHRSDCLSSHPLKTKFHDNQYCEILGLARAIDLDVISLKTVVISQVKSGTFFKSGKIEEISSLIELEKINLVVIDYALTAIQQRNLEKFWKCNIVDRTLLILEIFKKRARSKEGALQVERARLDYEKGRLVRSWTHLERQRGGRGFLGGPGEAQIESDRRLLQERINYINHALEKVVKTRQLHRVQRKKIPHKTVALVGYTNAGKSTLFNVLTGASVFAENMPFATLDPTLRNMKLPHGETVILSDTVGFISNLPTFLVAAFRATLEEVIEADLILHVRDISDPDTIRQKHDVMEVLTTLNVHVNDPTRIIEVWNKMDLVTEELQHQLERQAKFSSVPVVTLSSVTKQNINRLKSMIVDRLKLEEERVSIRLEPWEMTLLEWLYKHGKNHIQKNSAHGSLTIELDLTQSDFMTLKKKRYQLGLNREEN